MNARSKIGELLNVDTIFKNRTKLSFRSRILMVLWWLRQKPVLSTIAEKFNVSVSTVSRDNHFIVPRIYSVLDEIQWRSSLITHPVFGTSGSIDCGTHLRNRVHPKGVEYYRGDKHAHFITSQVVVDLAGTLLSVVLGKGHNNDRGFRIM